ncbi:MAG: TonB-dependent receptor [Pseudomonadota bacterium]
MSIAACAAFGTKAHAAPTIEKENELLKVIPADTTVVYEPEFFAIYRPVTALEMVQRVPGFRLDDGDDLRGFGANAGNVLINGERPSSKSGTLTNFLKRIPAERVSRIEVIRGATGALEARVQGVVVNIVLRQDEESARSVSWEAVADYDGGRLTPRAEAAFSNKFGSTDMTLAAERFAVRWRERGPEDLVSETMPQNREELETGVFAFWSGAVTTETPLSPDRVVRANVQVTDEEFATSERSVRTQVASERLSLFDQAFRQDEFQFEASIDAEAKVGRDLTGKLVFLLNYVDGEGVSELSIDAHDESTTQNVFAFDENRGEGIARLELGWSHWNSHQIQFGAESVLNFVDSDATFTVNGGEIPINGADSRVSELRTESFIIDSWQATKRMTIETGFALELSKIRQTGDFENERSFVYPKPTLAVTHNLKSGVQLRLRGERRVAQLNFDEFISATNFDDNDIDFGNPDLQPERTWSFRASAEKRFGEFGVLTVGGFHEWIDDVQDLLPLGGIFEAPGNIGDGQRWGGEVDLTATLAAVGLDNVRIETNAYIQGSVATDPVTGIRRRLSSERPWNYSIEFRQDFKSAGVAWGVGASDSGPDDFFGIDETVRLDEGIELNAFIETTRIRGVKVELRFGNLLNRIETRDRTVFSGLRSLSPVRFQENRDRRAGANVALVLSGAF